MRFLKLRTAAFFMAVAVVLTLTSCQNALEKAEAAYYEEQVLADLTAAADPDGRLPGISGNVCMLEDEAAFDSALIDADHCLLINENTKTVLYAKGAKEKIYPASLTKLMTALLVAEKCDDLSKRVQFTSDAMAGITEGASMAGLKEGLSYTVEDLLYALLVPSGNDAANCLAIYFYGSVDSFVAEMNRRALELGMLNTHFVNPNGLHDADHYTTAYDLYLLTREAAKHAIIKAAGSAAKAEVTGYKESGEEDVLSFVSTNSFIRQYSEVPAQVRISFSKTGYTLQAGRCLIMDVTDRSGQQIIAVMAHVESYDGLYEKMAELLSLVP